MTDVKESAASLLSVSDAMIAITHIPDQPLKTGVVVVVGGPTYRVGPQRTNVELARFLAESGFPVLRFDFRGTGDSQGSEPTPRQGPNVIADIRVAVDHLLEVAPEIEKVVLWGLCRGALRSLEYAPCDPRVNSIVLLNPRVDSQYIDASVTVKQYYWQRLTDWNFYRKLLSGDFSLRKSLRELRKTVIRLVPRSATLRDSSASNDIQDDTIPVEEFVDQCVSQFEGNALVILGTDDLEATKFREIMKASSLIAERQGEDRITVADVEGANHTFSSLAWREEVFSLTERWLLDADTS